MGSNPGDLNTNSVVKVGMAMEGMSNMFASNATADMNFGEKLDMTLTLGLMGSGAMESNLAVTNESNDAEVCAVSIR